MKRGGLFVLVALALGIRLWGLTLPGTIDSRVWKTWAAQAATEGLASLYGPSDSEVLRKVRESGRGILSAEFPRNMAAWQGERHFVDYPPGSLLVLWAAGKLYRSFDAAMSVSPLFNACVNLVPFLSSVAVALLLWRSSRGALGEARALAFWCNPAVILGAGILGYQDTLFGFFALAAVICLGGRRYVWACALVAAAGLFKPQGILVLPVVLVVLFHETGLRIWLRGALAGAAVAMLLFAPWWLQGHLLSALDGSLRPLTEAWLAPQGLNVWWLAGYALQWMREGAWPLARIVFIDEFHAWAGWDPRLLSRGILALVTVANMVWLARRVALDRAAIPLALIFQVHAYALLGTAVHENHAFLAVILAPLLLGAWEKAKTFLALTSALLFANLFLMEGLGRTLIGPNKLARLRMLAGLDLSVVVAMAHVALVVLLVLWMRRLRVPGNSLRATVAEPWEPRYP